MIISPNTNKVIMQVIGLADYTQLGMVMDHGLNTLFTIQLDL